MTLKSSFPCVVAFFFDQRGIGRVFSPGVFARLNGRPQSDPPTSFPPPELSSAFYRFSTCAAWFLHRFQDRVFMFWREPSSLPWLQDRCAFSYRLSLSPPDLSPEVSRFLLDDESSRDKDYAVRNCRHWVAGEIRLCGKPPQFIQLGPPF